MTTPITLEQVELALRNMLLEDKWSEDKNIVICYITQQAERLRVANEALQFYADEKNHHARTVLEGCGCCSDILESLVSDDNGDKAKAALAAQREG